MNFKKYLKWYFLALIFIANAFVWYAVFRESRNGILVAALDIGQGDAIFIETQNGNQILIDGGPNKKILEELGKIMPFYDRKIDALILTHSHNDHLNGLIEVLKNYKVSMVLESGTGDGKSYEEFEKIIKEREVPRFFIKRGTKLDMGSGTRLKILHPAVNTKNGEIHDQMAVSKLEYGKNSFLFTGDAEENVENYLALTQKENLKSQVLKAGHHGSRTSTSEKFLGWVSPEIAIISVGEKNKYGHPHKEILDRLNKFGVQIFRTDEEGTIKIKGDGENINISNNK